MLFWKQLELLKFTGSGSVKMTEQRCDLSWFNMFCLFVFILVYKQKAPIVFFLFFFDVLFLRQACKRMDRALGAMKPFCCKHLNQIFDVQLTPMY